MKIFANAVCALCLGALISGCAGQNENFVVGRGIEDKNVEFLKNSDDFTIKILDSTSKIDDNGMMNVDVTFEISRTPFWYWVFYGDPLLTLAYHFDWIDAQGKTDCLPWQFVKTLPSNILSFHGVAPGEKYVAYKMQVCFYRNGEVLPAPAQCGAASSAKHTDVKALEVKTLPAPIAVKAEAAVKADVKKPVVAAPKAEAAVKADVKTPVVATPKAEAAVKADVKTPVVATPKAEAAVKADVKKVETAVKADEKKVETAVKADEKKVATAVKADVKKVETAVKADVKKVETAVKADVKKVEQELKKDKLTESFY